ncbi:MAG: thioredoxin family protein [Dysgonamonadaceae bacterium]|jgi:peroxiredoxin|nr:thioredoxin family protein [Dysgonamonadaceae bacterium]
MNPSIKAVAAIVFAGVCGGISAQNIDIHFPRFAGKEYAFILNRGILKDTAQTGVMSLEGRATLAIPENFKGYAGRGSWAVIGSGNVDFIVNNEDFSIACEDSVPGKNNIFYAGSEENDRLNRYEREFLPIFQKTDSIYKAYHAAQNRDSLPLSFFREILPLQEAYAAFCEKSVGDSSYAAFFIKILNYMRGFGDKMYLPSEQKELRADFTHYVIEKMDVARLFNSGIWMFVMSFTFDAFDDETGWGEAMIKMFQRTAQQSAFEGFAKDVILACEQYGWDKAEEMIVNYLETSGRIASTGGMVRRAIAQSKIKIGGKAPLLSKTPTNALIIFYESGCEHCVKQLAEIAKRYPDLTKKGTRVISISTDESREVFEYHSKDYPWADKWCDFKGFNGENIKNYGIVGTPTIYLIDENGIILDRQSRIQDIKALNVP